MGFEAERESLGGVVVTGAEAGSQHPVPAEFNIHQHPGGGVDFVVFAGTEE